MYSVQLGGGTPVKTWSGSLARRAYRGPLSESPGRAVLNRRAYCPMNGCLPRHSANEGRGGLPRCRKRQTDETIVWCFAVGGGPRPRGHGGSERP